jgi:hypothetical protein
MNLIFLCWGFAGDCVDDSCLVMCVLISCVDDCVVCCTVGLIKVWKEICELKTMVLWAEEKCSLCLRQGNFETPCCQHIKINVSALKLQNTKSFNKKNATSVWGRGGQARYSSCSAQHLYSDESCLTAPIKLDFPHTRPPPSPKISLLRI